MGEIARLTSGTNGGPVFVYVKDGKIVRITPMDLADDDAAFLGHQGAGPHIFATAAYDLRPLLGHVEIAHLFSRSNPSSAQTGGL